MEYANVMQRLDDMKSRFKDGFSAIDRQFIDSVHFALYGAVVTKTGCSDCYRDAYLKIVYKLKKDKTMPKKSNYVLKTGAVITFFGESIAYTNANLTDEVAERYISMNSSNITLFESFPLDYEKRVAAFLEGKPVEKTVEMKESEYDDLKNALADAENKISEYEKEIEALKAEIETLKTPKTRTKKTAKKTENDDSNVEAEAQVAEAEVSTEENVTE